MVYCKPTFIHCYFIMQFFYDKLVSDESFIWNCIKHLCNKKYIYDSDILANLTEFSHFGIKVGLLTSKK
jgi:hypothetical protein